MSLSYLSRDNLSHISSNRHCQCRFRRKKKWVKIYLIGQFSAKQVTCILNCIIVFAFAGSVLQIDKKFCMENCFYAGIKVYKQQFDDDE